MLRQQAWPLRQARVRRRHIYAIFSGDGQRLPRQGDIILLARLAAAYFLDIIDDSRFLFHTPPPLAMRAGAGLKNLWFHAPDADYREYAPPRLSGHYDARHATSTLLVIFYYHL